MQPFDYMQLDGLAIAGALYERHGIAQPLPEIIVRPVRAGRFDFERWRIILPAWLWSDVDPQPRSFVEHYVAHELAHGLNGQPGHGLPFQLTLWSLAPDTWHYEADYKPRAYRLAHAAIYGTPGN